MGNVINIAKYPKEAVQILLGSNKPSILAFSSKELLKSFISILNSVSNDRSKQNGFISEVMLLGVGFRFSPFSSNTLMLSLGYSHEIFFLLNKDLKFKVLKQYLAIFGHNKVMATQTTAKIRSLRVPDIYKGKGIRYLNETVMQKKGKQKQQK
jgi:large subunit ribosomal protein L6